MQRKIKLNRGKLANLPQLDLGEPAVATDDGSLFIGTEQGNVKLAKDDEVQGISQQLADTEQKKADRNEVRLETATNPIRMVELHTEIKTAMTGGAVPVVGEEAVGRENVKPKAIEPTHTTFFEIDNRNIYDYTQNADGYRLTTAGTLYADPAYSTTDYLHVTPGSWTAGVKSLGTSTTIHLTNARAAFYDMDKNFVNLFTVPQSTNEARYQVFPIETEGYIRLSFSTPYKEAAMVMRSEVYDPGTYIPHNFAVFRDEFPATPKDHSVFGTKIRDKGISTRHVDFIETGKNLFDKNDVQLNKFYTGREITDLIGYYAKNPFTIEGGKTYTFSPVRYIRVSNMDGVEIYSLNTNDNNGTITYSPPVDAIVYMAGAMAHLDTTQVEEGPTRTEYEPFGLMIPDIKLTDKQTMLIAKKVEESAKQAAAVVEIEKTGNAVLMRSSFGDSGTIEIATEKVERQNKVFNFLNTKVNGTQIHNNNDDVAPIRTFTTVGANHGYTTIVIVNGPHDKTAADVGSQWTDGTENFTLLIVEPEALTFGCDYTVTSTGLVTSTRRDPVAPLTHVIGATNTGEIDVSNLSYGQLYPSIGSYSLGYYMDGEEVTFDGTHTGGEFQVRERYNVLDYKGIIDTARDSVGVDWRNRVDNIPGLVEITNVYTFRKGLKCTVNTGFRALNKVSFGRCGILQSGALNGSGFTRTRYMMGVSEKGGHDFRTGIDLDAYSDSLVFTQADNVDPELPPNHYIDWLSNADGRFAGYAMGYIPDKTDTKNASRIANANTTWDMRGTDKSYPVAIEGVTLEAGQYMSFMGFRNYVSPEEAEEAILVTDVEDGGNVYTFADFSDANQTHRDTAAGEIGDDILTVQTQGVKSNENIDFNGVVLSSIEPLSAGVFKRRK